MPKAVRHILYALMMLGVTGALQANYTPLNDDFLLNPEEDETDSEKSGIVEKAGDIVDGAQQQVSERFNNFILQVDGFFGDAATLDNAESNRSWARLRLDGIRPTDGGVELDPSLKLRITLPQTEKRFKLLFSTEEDDTNPVDESIGRTQSAENDNNQNASVAIRFIRSARARARVNLDLGLRQRDSDLQLFLRLNTGQRKDFGDYWSFSVANSYYYYNRSGFEDSLSFNFRRANFFRDDVIFRSFTEFNWRNGRQGAVIAQTIGAYRQIDERRSLAFEVLAGYHTALNEGIEDRFRGHEYRFRWRHNIWRPWFYYEFWPSISWPATNNFDQSFGVLLRMEMVIGQR